MKKLQKILLFLLILFLPTQLGKHFWPNFAFVFGQRIDYLSPTLYVTDILAVFFIFISFGIKLKRSLGKTVNQDLRLIDKKRKRSLYVLSLIYNSYFLILGGMLIIIGILLSKNPLAGWFHLLKLLEFLLLGIAIKHYLSEQTNNRLFIIYPLVFGILFESLLAIWQFFNQASIGGIFYYFGERTFTGNTPGIANASLNGELILRPYATFSHPNVLAGYLVIAMTIIIFDFYPRCVKDQFSISYEWLKVKMAIIKKIILLLTLALGTFVLFLSLSRIAILVWLIILAYKVFVYLKKKNNVGKNSIYYLLSIVILLGVASLFFFTPLRYRYTILGFQDESVTDRLILIQAAWKMIIKQPLFGIGFGNFFTELPFSLQSYQAHSTILLQPVHNIFLLIASETGIPVLFGTLWFLYGTFKRNLQHSSEYNLNIILLVVIFVLGMFDHYFLTLQQGQLLFMIVLALCWVNRNESDTIHP